MTGQEKILALRRSGLSPRTVWVDDFPGGASDGASVFLSPQDVPEQQDWRFLVGLTALVAGTDARRLARIAAACRPFAKRVIASLHSAAPVVDAYGHHDFPILGITDTDEVLTWPA